MTTDTKQVLATYTRNFIFGAEDSLVSTVGLLSGIAAAGVERSTIITTGMVLVVVEALSMAGGSFLSEYSTNEYMAGEKPCTRVSITAASIMFGAYFMSGLVPLLPYVFYESEQAFGASIIFSLTALFLLGVFSARFLRIRILSSGLRMFIIGGAAITAGVLVGQLIN